MDGTNDETDRRTRLHSASQRLLVLLLIGVLCVVGVAVVSGGPINESNWTYFEDFEDGDPGDWYSDVSPPQIENFSYEDNHSMFSDFSDAHELADKGFSIEGDNTLRVRFLANSEGGELHFEIGDRSGFDNLERYIEIATVPDLDLREWDSTGIISEDTAGSYNQSGWKMYEMVINNETNQAHLYVWEPTDTKSNATHHLSIDLEDNMSAWSNKSDLYLIHIGQNGGAYIDEIGADAIPDFGIHGTVIDRDNKALKDVEINATDGNGTWFNTTTDLNGNYNLDTGNGTFTVTASKATYGSVSKTAVVSGNQTEVNFVLTTLNETLILDVNRWMGHGTSQRYRVLEEDVDNNTRTDVTDQATVTSGNTTVITVDSVDNELDATSDISINRRVTITATYNNKTTTENVTVANKTVDHIDILPPWERIEAILDPGTEENPNDHSAMIIIIATWVAVAGTLLFSTFVGLGGFSAIIVAGWLMGYSTTGLMLVVLTVVGFVGLNLAANIDYAVR